MMTGCDKWQTERAKHAKRVSDEKREVALIDGYYSADILIAERSLLQLMEHYSNLQPPDGDDPKRWTRAVERTIGLSHTRLYLLYTQLGRTNDATNQRELLLKQYPNHDEGETWGAFLKAVEGLDRNREVKWKQANR